MSNKHYIKGMKRRARRGTGLKHATIKDLYDTARASERSQIQRRQHERRLAEHQRNKERSASSELDRMARQDAIRKGRIRPAKAS